MNSIISIIIPTFNRESFIGEALDSVLAQTYPHWECLVVDDGSTDSSETVIKAYCERDQRIRFYYRPTERPKGANSCRNYGLELSQGDYVNWFDSDDLMHPDKLEQQIRVLEDGDDPFCVCHSLVFERNLDHIKGLKSGALISNRVFEDFLDQKIIIPVQAPVFKRTFLETHGYQFNETLQAAQEWHFLANILFYHPTYAIIERPLDYIRVHTNNISNAISQDKYWHYFLARLKLYKDLHGRLSEKSITILHIYFLFFYKAFARQFNFKKAWYVWRVCLIPIKALGVRDHFYLLTGLVFYTLFKKGDGLLSKVSLHQN